MKRKPKVIKDLSAVEQVMRLVPVGGWVRRTDNGGLEISDGRRRHVAGDYETLLKLIQLSPFSPSASHQTDQQPSASTEDSRGE